MSSTFCFSGCCNTVFRSPNLPVGYWLYCNLFYLRLILQTTVLVFFSFYAASFTEACFYRCALDMFCITYLLRWLVFLRSLFRVYSCCTVLSVLSGLRLVGVTDKSQSRLFSALLPPAVNPFAVNPLSSELNPICYLLALLGVHHFLHVSRIRVKLLTFRLLMSYIWSTHS